MWVYENMHIHMIYKCVCLFMHISLFLSFSFFVGIYTYICTCIYIYTYVYMYICIYVYMYMYTYVYIYIYIYIHIYICIYMYIYYLYIVWLRKCAFVRECEHTERFERGISIREPSYCSFSTHTRTCSPTCVAGHANILWAMHTRAWAHLVLSLCPCQYVCLHEWVWCCRTCSHSCSSRTQPLLSVSAALPSQIIYSSFFASPLSASAPVFSSFFSLVVWLYFEVVCAMVVSKVSRRGIRCGAFVKLSHVGLLRLINITWASVMCMYVPHTFSTFALTVSRSHNIHILKLLSIRLYYVHAIIFVPSYTDLDEMQTHMHVCPHDMYAIAYAVTDT